MCNICVEKRVIPRITPFLGTVLDVDFLGYGYLQETKSEKPDGGVIAVVVKLILCNKYAVSFILS